MAVNTETMSLTRPKAPETEYGKTSPQFFVGLVLAGVGMMSLFVLFIISAIVAGWVSDQDPADFGRILAYNSWLFPAAIASVAVTKIGIAIILWGIVRTLWVRVASLKESLPALIKPGSDS